MRSVKLISVQTIKSELAISLLLYASIAGSSSAMQQLWGRSEAEKEASPVWVSCMVALERAMMALLQEFESSNTLPREIPQSEIRRFVLNHWKPMYPSDDLIQVLEEQGT